MARILGTVLWLFSFLFHFALAMFLVIVGFFGLATGEEVRFELILGVEGESLIYTMIAAGTIALLLSLFAWLRSAFPGALFVLWNLLVVSLVLCAVARSSYRFSGMTGFQSMLGLLGLAVLALWGSWSHWRWARRGNP
jgi:hypothetical protein